MAVFLVGAVAAAVAPTLGALVAARFVAVAAIFGIGGIRRVSRSRRGTLAVEGGEPVPAV